MFRVYRTRLTLLSVLAGCLLNLPVLRGEDLFRLVTSDAAVCVHASGLADNWQRLERSEFANRVLASPFLDGLIDSRKLGELIAVQGALEAVLQRPLRETAESLFGQNVVLATYVIPGSDPDFVLLLEADRTESIASALTAWQVLDGVQAVEHEHRGVTYRSLTNPDRPDDESPLVVQFDRILAAAQNEERLRQLIDLRLDGPSGSLAALTPFTAATGTRPDGELVAVSLNPRALDSTLAHLAGPSEPLPRVVQKVWQRCRWLTLRLVLETDHPAEPTPPEPGQTESGAAGVDRAGDGTTDALRLEVVADYDSQGAPAWWQQWVDVAETRPLPLERIPRNAVVALSGQFSGGSLQSLMRGSLPENGQLPADVREFRRVSQGLLLGLDPFADLLPAIGPDWLAYCVPRPATDAQKFPVDALIALDLQPERLHATDTAPGTVADAGAETETGAVETPDDRPSLPEALDNALLTGLNVLAAEHNARTTGPVAVVRHRTVAEGTIRWADPVSRFRPAYAVSDRFLLVASTPELCEDFLKNAASDRNESRTKSPSDPTGYWLTRTTVARTILAAHRDWFLWQARRDHLSDSEARRRLTELDSLLKLTDQVELSASLSESRIRVSLSLTAGTRQQEASSAGPSGTLPADVQPDDASAQGTPPTGTDPEPNPAAR